MEFSDPNCSKHPVILMRS